MMKKINIVIVTLAILSISIETIRGNYPWILNKEQIVLQNNPSDINSDDTMLNTYQEEVCISN